MARLLIKKVNRYNAFEQKSYQDMLILHKPSPTHIYNQVIARSTLHTTIN